MKRAIVPTAYFVLGVIVTLAVLYVVQNRGAEQLRRQEAFITKAKQEQPIGLDGGAKPEWQLHLDWSFQNREAGGAVNCAGDYIGFGVPNCIAIGGRTCVMNYAKEAAQRGNNGGAFSLAKLTQCHNDRAKNLINAAGESAVAGYVFSHQTY